VYPDKCFILLTDTVCVYCCLCSVETMSSDDVSNTQQGVQYVLYQSDSVEVTYADGTCIQLSPCGSTFICQQPLSADTQHPLNGIIIVKSFLTCVI